MVRRLRVIDGADQGRFYPLPAGGTVTIGSSHKSADIVLHDLYVSRVHCELKIDDDGVVVHHMAGQGTTLVNNQRITEQTLGPEDVLRVGNSHLRVETVTAEEAAAAGKGAAPKAEGAGYKVAGAKEEEEVEGEEGEADEVEYVEDEDGEAEEVEEVEEAGEPFALPHSAVDQLLKLEDQVLGHYKIGPLLGRGHSGVVFRAHDQRTKQAVALKVLSPDFPDNDAESQRFVKALKVTVQLPHPHLTTLYGAGKNNSLCWIAREYVEGESLARLIQRLHEGGKLDWTRACRVAVHVGRALDFLHKHKISHGNLTPRNLLVRGSDRATKVTDLMLSQALERSRLQKSILGKKLVAELAYLAPEQTDPHAPGSPRGDLYALGAILYALVTGLPPFQGDTPRDVVARIREGKVVRPSRYQRSLPGPFEEIILTLMGRRPEDRFSTAGELLATVEPLAEENDIEV
jgi:hypothetical protein